MGDVINFRQARKDMARKTREAAAAQNRAAFGRTKVQKLQDGKITDIAERRLEAHRRDDGKHDAARPDDDGKAPA